MGITYTLKIIKRRKKKKEGVTDLKKNKEELPKFALKMAAGVEMAGRHGLGGTDSLGGAGLWSECE